MLSLTLLYLGVGPYANLMLTTPFSKDTSSRMSTCNNHQVLSIKIIHPMSANCERQFMALNKHLEHDIMNFTLSFFTLA